MPTTRTRPFPLRLVAVPSGLSGMRIGFQSCGFYAPATVGVSDVEQVSFP